MTVGGKSAYKMPGRRVEETMFAAIIDDTKMVVAPTEKDLTAAFAAAAGGRKPVISKELAGSTVADQVTGPDLRAGMGEGQVQRRQAAETSCRPASSRSSGRRPRSA